MIAGIISWAVGDELVIAHPTDVLPAAEIVMLVSGPALYLLGHVLFRLRMAGTLSRKRLAGALACVAVGGLGPVVPGLVLSALLVAVVVGVIGAERIAEVRRRARGEPSPGERLESSVGSG
jgi:low temperature requirement protein LtrA